MNVTAERRALIETELTKNGVVVTDEAIAFVVDYMAKNNRATVASSARAYAKSVGSNANATRSNARGQQAAQKLGADADTLARQLGNRLRDKIGAQALDYALADLAEGNLGDLATRMLGGFTTSVIDCLDAEILELEEAENDRSIRLIQSSHFAAYFLLHTRESAPSCPQA